MANTISGPSRPFAIPQPNFAGSSSAVGTMATSPDLLLSLSTQALGSPSPFGYATPTSSNSPPSTPSTLFSSPSAPLVADPPAASEEMLQEIVSKAVEGNSRTGWPFRYTRDMAAGFILLNNRGGTPRARATDFATAFGCAYKSSTYNNNWRIWDKACNERGVNAQSIVIQNDSSTETVTWRKFRTIFGGTN